jgi:hypothetical protein
MADNALPSVVGTVKGPGETGNQYVFITSDNRYVKIGEYVFYKVMEGDKERHILGNISERKLIDHLPDRLFADANLNPRVVTALVGLSDDAPEIYEVAVEVIGYFEPGLGFMNPRKTPDPGAKVFLATNQMLRLSLNRKQCQSGSAAAGEGGGAYCPGREGAGQYPHGDLGRDRFGEVLYGGGANRGADAALQPGGGADFGSPWRICNLAGDPGASGVLCGGVFAEGEGADAR